MESSEVINGVIWLIVTIIAIIPVIVFSKTYMKVKSKRILLTTVAFFLFFIKALTLAMRLIVPEGDEEVWYLNDEFWWSIAAILDIIIIGLIVLALQTKE